MKKVFFSLMLFCGLALIDISCKKNNENNDNNNAYNNNETPEVEVGLMTIEDNTLNITTADVVSYGQWNAIVLASKAMTSDKNEGIAIIFNGNVTSGTYKIGDNIKGATPKVVGLHKFNMSELPFVMGTDRIYFGDVYFWRSGLLSITENGGIYTVILSQCIGNSPNGSEINLALNYKGTLAPYAFDTNNKFKIGSIETSIGLAGVTSLGGMSSLGIDVKSMLFMSANRKRFFIVSFLGDQIVDGEYNLGHIVTSFPCVHVALDNDLWTFQPQTGYIAKSGTLKVTTNEDGTKTITMENLELKNLEHDDEILFPILDGSLRYHGMMYEIGN